MRNNPTGLSHYTPTEVAKLLGVSRQAVQKRIARGSILTETHMGKVRIPARELCRLLEEQCQKK